MSPVAAGRKGRGAGGSLGKAAEVGWKAGVSVFLRASSVVFPVNSVNAHNEGLNVRVGGAAELAAGLSAERGAVA